MSTTLLLDAVTATGAGPEVNSNRPKRTVEITVTGTGAVSATVTVRARQNTADNWLILATLTATGTTSASEGVALESSWAYISANCTAISGTGATLTSRMETQP